MIRIVKRFVRKVLMKTVSGHLFYIRRDEGIKGSSSKPSAPWHNAVLQTKKEVTLSKEQVSSINLPLNGDDPKNWDSLAALDCIVANTDRNSRILDAGAEIYSTILPWLALLGYRNLFGNNLVFDKTIKRGSIIYQPGDLTKTEFEAGSFDAISCISVIEHGVDLNAYLVEMHRLLKPGGVLITSTDYWADKIDAKGKEFYGVPVKIFDKNEILTLFEAAKSIGFELTSEIDLTCNEKAVHWKAVSLDYTFIVFSMRKTQ